MSDCAVEEFAFAAAIRQWVTDGLARTTEFGALVRGLPGVDPLVVVQALTELSGDVGVLARQAAAARAEAASSRPTSVPTAERPVPHPLEFYWAHDAASVETLVLRAGQATGADDCIAYLGAPNIYGSALERLPDRRNVLLDRNVLRTQAMRRDGRGEVLQLDLQASPLPQLSAAFAVMDPPWYPESMRGFLWAGGRVLAVGGLLAASFPPAGARPSIHAEVRDILMWADAGGLELVDLQPGALRYLSPPFELASHRAAGIGGVPRDWRTGDLVTLRLVRPFEQPRPPFSAEAEQWLPFVIDEIPVWIRQRNGASGTLGPSLLRSLVDDDVLHSVSRRNPVRQQADVWSSLNRVWSSTSPTALQAICRALSERAGALAAVESELARKLDDSEARHVDAVAECLRDVVRRERKEHCL